MTNEPSTGRIEALIADFHSFERPLFSSLSDDNGFAWWDLVRYDIQFRMLVKQGLHPEATTPQRKKYERTASAGRRMAAFAFDLAKLPRLLRREVDALIVSRRALEPIVKAVNMDSSGHFIVGSREFSQSRSLLIDKYHIDLLIAFAARFMAPPAGVLNAAKKVERDFEQAFNIQVPVHALIESKYRKHMAANNVWSKILSLPSSVSRLVFVNDDTVKTLVWLCRRRGIDTTEVQHGYMGASHIGFSYPKLDEPLMTMPHRTIITRDTGDISYPSPLARSESHSSSTAVPKIEERDIDVLIGSGPRWSQRTLALVAAFAQSGMRLAVKLHPAQLPEDLGPDFTAGPQKVEVFGGKEPFLPIARRAKIYLPVNPGSTTSFEAWENGCALVLYEPQGKPNTSVVNHLAAAISSHPDELLARIRDILDWQLNSAD